MPQRIPTGLGPDDDKPLHDSDKITFGRYLGRTLQDVPADYLLYVWDDFVRHQVRATDKHHRLYLYIRINYRALETELKDYIPQHRPK